jgi:hypothetical protein
MNRRRFLQYTFGTSLAAWQVSQPKLVAAEPALRTSRKLLFVNDSDVLYTADTHRVLRPLDRHPSNPVRPGKSGGSS